MFNEKQVSTEVLRRVPNPKGILTRVTAAIEPDGREPKSLEVRRHSITWQTAQTVPTDMPLELTEKRFVRSLNDSLFYETRSSLNEIYMELLIDGRREDIANRLFDVIERI
jgi:hypothetical protein